MKKYTIQLLENSVLESVSCDVCGVEYSADDFEVQEFLHINYEAGYGAKLGDTNKIQCDICEDCVIEKLGEHLRITETDMWSDWNEERNLNG